MAEGGGEEEREVIWKEGYKEALMVGGELRNLPLSIAEI